MPTRSPYKTRQKLAVTDDVWRVDDVVIIGGTRWVFREVSATGRVKLEAANKTNYGLTWTTTLDKLPTKESTR